MSTFRRIFSLILKELRILFGDKQGRGIIIMPVIIQAIVFPLAATMEVKNATLAIYDQDHGPASIELIQRFQSAKKTFSQFLFLENEAQLNKAIEEQEALAVVRIPPDFSRNLTRGTASSMQLIIDGRRSNSGQIASSYIQQIVQDYQLERLQATHASMSSEIVARSWFNPNLEYLNFIVPNLIALIVTASVLTVTALSVAREREYGTFDQLLVSPLTPEMIMIGKIMPAVLVAVLQASVVLCIGIFAYHVPFQGSFVLLYTTLLIYALSLAGIGLFISAICATQQQAYLGMFSFMVPAMTLSGFAAPVENMPVFLQHLSWFSPIRHYLKIVEAIYLKNASLNEVAELTWPLLIICIVSLIVAGILFRKKVA